ncbi:pyrimidine 5'-nucleotidase [Radiomyces spectabilis]|uniref:pyrimidine 5'-nucleotidase n=1 Tax=Radiomyces spectabilis TaxID=64574 RepID=UPI00221E56EB|nr:pyrimidine 5'-nucleotidase [Radiomyces spectabilis]KAI8381530.1 pyrimidine 5'-nucleotidase [Radiomyces spectabilis]
MTTATSNQAPVFFFDCDNCLYHKNLGILTMMRERIVKYIKDLGIPEEDAIVLRNRYHLDYGLALRGLLKHHQVDPIDYDEKVDQSLPLESVMKPDPALKDMLSKLKMKKWVFTNAYQPHATRVLNILGIADEFDGMTFCDYRIPNFDCKPEVSFYHKAMAHAGISDPTLCYLVDDSAANIDAAKQLGWKTVHLADDASQSHHGDYQIEDIHELPNVLPELWK